MASGKKYYRLGVNQQKVLLLLMAGIGLGLAKTPGQYYKVLKNTHWEWQKINDRALKQAIASLYKSKLVSEKENKDGSVSIILTDHGKKKALTYNLDTIQIKKPSRWDGQWRMILFDIPEKHKKAREAFREMLKNLEFCEFQKSVFIHPYECQNELDYIIEFFQLRSYVRTITAAKLDNELHFKKIFGLT